MYKLLTKNVLVDKGVLRFNDRKTRRFRSLYFALDANWEQIPFIHEQKRFFSIVREPDDCTSLSLWGGTL